MTNYLSDDELRTETAWEIGESVGVAGVSTSTTVGNYGSNSTVEPSRANDWAPDTHLDWRWLSLPTIVAHPQPADNTPRRTPRVPYLPLAAIGRWYARSIVVTPSGCHIWTGSKTRNGYGQVGVAGARKMAHRAVYEVLVGSIPDGADLDHLCRERACVNIAHLEPVTRSENLRRGWRDNPRPLKSHCNHGHAFTLENTRVAPDGRRCCRACANRIAREARVRRGAN